MHIRTINEKRAHEFERDQGEVYGRLWRKKGRGKLCNFIISKMNLKIMVYIFVGFMKGNNFFLTDFIFNGMRQNR